LNWRSGVIRARRWQRHAIGTGLRIGIRLRIGIGLGVVHRLLRVRLLRVRLLRVRLGIGLGVVHLLLRGVRLGGGLGGRLGCHLLLSSCLGGKENGEGKDLHIKN
jgi:hypothetical protein